MKFQIIIYKKIGDFLFHNQIDTVKHFLYFLPVQMLLKEQTICAIVRLTVDLSSDSVSLGVQTFKPHPFKSRRKHLTIVLLTDMLLIYVHQL